MIVRNEIIYPPHFWADAAFIYDFEQEATYFFINVDPQFQSFNNGNWKAAEAKARDMAQKQELFSLHFTFLGRVCNI